MRQGLQRQRGIALMVMVVLIMFLALGVIISKTGELVASVGRQFSVTNETQSRIQKALVSFVGTYGRLPCPARPSGATNPGWPDDISPLSAPAAGSVCVYSYGVVPWNALGLSQEQVMDEWGRMISYRVYDGTFGLTQDKGASALNCDSSNFNAADGSTVPSVAPTGNGLCDNTYDKHNTLRSDFITHATFNKGLYVYDFGPVANAANVSNVAYVLISHGPSGLGAYLPNGTRMAMPDNTARDYGNTQPNIPPNTPPPTSFFIKQAASAAGVPAGTAGHYDDIVSYLTIAELLKLANQEARDWPEGSLPSFSVETTDNMTSPSIDPLNPHFMTSPTPGQGFTPADGGTAVEVGGASFGTFSSCLWWPTKLNVVNGTSRYLIAASVEFAAADMSSAESFPGFTLGFLPGSDAAGPPTNSTCGTNVAATTTAVNVPFFPTDIFVTSSTGIEVGMAAYGTGIALKSKVVSVFSFFGIPVVRLDLPTTGTVETVNFSNPKQIRRDLGWAGGTLASYANRFAVEVDSNIDVGSVVPPVVLTANDPSRPHLAVDFTGVTHGTDAGSCATVGSGLPCDSQITDFAAVNRLATGLSGGVDITITDPLGITGIVLGMSVSGNGIGPSATVISISGNVVTLSAPNTGAVSGSVAFSSLSTANFMQSGLTVFHNARVEVSPNDCVSPTGTGALAGSTITVSSNTGIASGMSVYGIGVSGGAKVTGVSGTTVTLSSPNLAAVSGTIVFGGSAAVVTSASGLSGQDTILVANPNGITQGMTVTGAGIASGAMVQSFSGSTVTLSIGNTGDVSGPMTFAIALPLTRTLVKTWTLSNPGCNESPVTCTALKNTSIKFTADLSTNRQAMQAVSCVPAPTVANAYDSLYFGITTANRGSDEVPVTNVKFRKLFVQMPLLP